MNEMTQESLKWSFPELTLERNPIETNVERLQAQFLT